MRVASRTAGCTRVVPHTLRKPSKNPPKTLPKPSENPPNIRFDMGGVGVMTVYGGVESSAQRARVVGSGVGDVRRRRDAVGVWTARMSVAFRDTCKRCEVSWAGVRVRIEARDRQRVPTQLRNHPLSLNLPLSLSLSLSLSPLPFPPHPTTTTSTTTHPPTHPHPHPHTKWPFAFGA